MKFLSATEKLAIKIADELGEKLIEEIGSGDFGVVFSLESGRVLKLTYDTNEIIIAKKLARHKNLFKYILNYYNVGEIENTTNDFKYFILMDYVEPLPKEEKVMIDYVFKPIFQFSKSFYKSAFDDELIDNINHSFTTIKLKQNRPLLSSMYDIYEMKKNAISFIPHIKNIAKELKKHNIEQCDFHGGNLGWNHDHTRLILFDITKRYDPYGKQPKVKLKKYSVLEEYNYPTPTIKKRILEIADDLGEEIDSYLGGGGYGFAYKTKSGKVLKITSDENEVHIAYKLSKNKKWSKYIVNYYNVGEINILNKNIGLDTNVYKWYILMDYVGELTENEKDAIHCYKGMIQNNPEYYENVKDKKNMIDHIQFVLFRPNSVENKRILANERDPKDVEKIAIDIYPKILNIVKELKLKGVHDTDFHQGNLGWDENHENLILYDLGGEMKSSYRTKDKFKQISTTEKLITRFKRF